MHMIYVQILVRANVRILVRASSYRQFLIQKNYQTFLVAVEMGATDDEAAARKEAVEAAAVVPLALMQLCQL